MIAAGLISLCCGYFEVDQELCRGFMRSLVRVCFFVSFILLSSPLFCLVNG